LHFRHAAAADGLPPGDGDSNRFRTLFRPSGGVFFEIPLDVDPVGPATGGIEQDQEDRDVLDDPEVVIPNVQVEDVMRSGLRQRFGPLDNASGLLVVNDALFCRTFSGRLLFPV